MSFVEDTNRNVGWGLITITEGTQRQPHHQSLSQRTEYETPHLDYLLRFEICVGYCEEMQFVLIALK